MSAATGRVPGSSSYPHRSVAGRKGQAPHAFRSLHRFVTEFRFAIGRVEQWAGLDQNCGVDLTDERATWTARRRRAGAMWTRAWARAWEAAKWFGRRRALMSVLMGLAAIAAVTYLVVAHREDMGATLAALPLASLAALLGLQVGVFFLRAEVWRTCSNEANGRVPGTHAHAGSGANFLFNNVNHALGPAARVAFLRRHLGREAPPASQVIAADAPGGLLDALLSVVLLLVASFTLGLDLWIPIVAGIAVVLLVPAAYLLRAKLGRRKVARALDVLVRPQSLVKVVLFMAVVYAVQVFRTWLILDVVGLEPSLFAAALVFVGTGLLGFLPVGPSAGAGASLAIFGSAGVAAATTAGLALSLTAIAGALAYCVLAAVAVLVRRIVIAARVRRALAQARALRAARARPALQGAA